MVPILVVGSANADLVMRCERIPNPGETLLGAEFATYPGGKGANQAVAAARIGAAVSLIAAVGDDSHGRLLRNVVESEGVDCTAMTIVEGVPTGVGVILVDDAGENRIMVASGANMKLSAEMVESRIDAQAEESIIVSQLEVPLECIWAASRAKRFVLNPAPAQAVPLGILARAEVVTPNQWEAQMITGVWPDDDASCQACADWFLRSGVQHVVITLGSLGASWHTHTTAFRFPAPKVRVVDTTAAGDAFTGSLVAYLALGLDMEHSIANAVASASLSVTRNGAIPSLPYAIELSGVA